MVKNNSKHEAFESKTGDGSLALRVENYSAADFFGFTDYLGFHGINSFGKGFVKIFMVGFAGKLLAFVTAIDAHMIRFICNFVQFNVKSIFIVSNFYQFFKSLMYVLGNSF
jgi:hypothetical protein